MWRKSICWKWIWKKEGKVNKYFLAKLKNKIISALKRYFVVADPGKGPGGPGAPTPPPPPLFLDQNEVRKAETIFLGGGRSPLILGSGWPPPPLTEGLQLPLLSNGVFSLTWLASMQIYWNKRKRLHKKRVQLPQDWFGTPTWLPFHCFGSPIWPPWHHVKTLNSFHAVLY